MSNPSILFALGVLSSLWLAAGCVADLEGYSDPQDRPGVTPKTCGLQCGTNGLEPLGNGLETFDKKPGVPNPSQTYTIQYYKLPSGEIVTDPNAVELVWDTLRIWDSNGYPWEGAELTGLEMFLEYRPDDQTGPIEVGLHFVDHTYILHEGVESTEMHGYEVRFSENGEMIANLCNSLPEDPVWSVIQIHEEYIKETYKIGQTGAAAADLFNITCGSSSVGKMKRLGYDQAWPFAGNYAHSTDVNARQAALKMYSGDFCGTGDAFTENGTLIGLEDDIGVIELYTESGMVEAEWTENGATCLDWHRLSHGDSTLNAQWHQDIADVCGELPPCHPETWPHVGVKVRSFYREQP